MSQGLRLMAVHAHPDDESSKGAASTARYVKEGAQVMVVSLTGGERGDVLNPAIDPNLPREQLIEMRRDEMARAAEILGVEHAWLGFIDSGLPEGDPLPPLPEDSFAVQPLDVATERLVRLVREFRPHVMTTYDESGGYPHPDHIKCHEVSVAAFEAAGDPDLYPEAGDPWQPLKLYYHVTFHMDRFKAVNETAERYGVESPFSGERFQAFIDGNGPELLQPTTHIECGDYFTVRDDALRAHATQVDPEGFWFKLPLDMQIEAWPTEDFLLARSLVDTTFPEDDLFAGIDRGGVR